METQLIISLSVSLVLFVWTMSWMINMLRYTKENRIIQSMTLKAILEYCDSKGAKINIEKIQADVESQVK